MFNFSTQKISSQNKVRSLKFLRFSQHNKNVILSRLFWGREGALVWVHLFLHL